MTERTKTIKRLISGQVDMGTFGLVELELFDIEKETERLKEVLLTAKEYCSNTNVIDAIDRVLTNH